MLTRNPLAYLPSVRDILKSEPLRLRAYALTVIVAGYLLARHIVAPTDRDFIVSVAAIVLGVESSRSKVTPSE